MNEAIDKTSYEKLGVEKLNDRLTTKYRVTSVAPSTGTESRTVTLIWIDEALGMPVRSETASADADHQAKLTTELRDIKLQVDPKLFELPNDYKQVAYSEFLDQWRQARSGGNIERGKP